MRGYEEDYLVEAIENSWVAEADEQDIGLEVVPEEQTDTPKIIGISALELKNWPVIDERSFEESS